MLHVLISSLLLIKIDEMYIRETIPAKIIGKAIHHSVFGGVYFELLQHAPSTTVAL